MIKYIPYKTPDYIGSYDESQEEPSKIWSLSHRFDVESFTDVVKEA